MDKPFIEAFKEGMRVVVLAIIPIVVVELENGGLDWKLIGVTAAVAFLRFVDSWLHESAKEQPKAERNEGLMGEKGLVGF